MVITVWKVINILWENMWNVKESKNMKHYKLFFSTLVLFIHLLAI